MCPAVGPPPSIVSRGCNGRRAHTWDKCPSPRREATPTSSYTLDKPRLPPHSCTHPHDLVDIPERLIGVSLSSDVTEESARVRPRLPRARLTYLSIPLGVRAGLTTCPPGQLD